MAPSALPTALVSRPTEPSSCAPMLDVLPAWHQPERSGDQPYDRVELGGDDRAQRLELGGEGRAGEIEDPADEAEAERAMTISSRQPRPIGSTRPSSRAPPSRNTAKTRPPTISSSGWARTMMPMMASAMPEPDGGALRAPGLTSGIAELGRAGLLDVDVDRRGDAHPPARPPRHQRRASSLSVDPRSELPARPPRSALEPAQRD